MQFRAPGNSALAPSRANGVRGLKQIDMSLSKRFVISESKFVEFRFEAINAFYMLIFALSGYATECFPGGGIDKSKYGVDPTYTAGIPPE